MTAALAVTAALCVDEVGARWALVTVSPLAAAAVVIDARTLRIPTRLAAACAIVALTSCVVLATVRETWAPLLAGVAAAAAVGIVFLALWRLTGLGMGDVRLATALAPIAGLTGWQTVAAFIVLTHLAAAPLALWAWTQGRRDLAFGPAVVAGLYLTVAVAPTL